MRWPHRNGLAVPLQELGFETVPHERRKTTNHHLYWDRAWYMDKRYRQIFRGLLPHVQTMRTDDHIELHERFSGSVVPKDSLMIDVIDEYLSLNGVIDVVREKRTRETYELTADQWDLYKRQYRGVHGAQSLYTAGNR